MYEYCELEIIRPPGTKASLLHNSQSHEAATQLLERANCKQSRDLIILVMSTEKMDTTVDRRSRSTGIGVYVPPAKLRAMQQKSAENGEIIRADETSQKTTWEVLKKTINGSINRLNLSNIRDITLKLFQEANLVRGRGIFARSLLKATLASPSFAHVYAALVAVISAKLPENGELVLNRAVLAFKRSYKRRDKGAALALVKFIAHLVNQSVAHELLALQMLTVLLEDPTDDSVEIAVTFTLELGQYLEEVSPKGMHAIMERFRAILHQGDIDQRVQYTIENLFAIRKGSFAQYPAIVPALDLVEREDQITFEIGLDDEIMKQELLDVYRFDDKYEENEELWSKIRAEILGESDNESSDDDASTSSGSDESSEEGSEKDEQEGTLALTAKEKQTTVIHDLSETDLIHLRRTIYLTIMSAATFEECAHKLAKIDIPPTKEYELINMIIECCSQERTFLRYYGLISQRFCLLHSRWREAFVNAFREQYSTVHRLETNKLRNVAKLFAHLLHTDSLSWSDTLNVIHLNEDETTSSSRIFVKILVQEIAEALGIVNLKERLLDPELQESLEGMFPQNASKPRDTRYAINFFTSIGLGPLTDGLREFLKNAPKIIMAQAQAQAEASTARNSISRSSDDDSSTSSSSSSSYTSSSSSSYSSRSRSSERMHDRGRRRQKLNRRSRSLSSSSSSSRSSSESSNRRTRRSNSQQKRRRSSSRSISSGDRHQQRQQEGSDELDRRFKRHKTRSFSRSRSSSRSRIHAYRRRGQSYDNDTNVVSSRSVPNRPENSQVDQYGRAIPMNQLRHSNQSHQRSPNSKEMSQSYYSPNTR